MIRSLHGRQHDSKLEATFLDQVIHLSHLVSTYHIAITLPLSRQKLIEPQVKHLHSVLERPRIHLPALLVVVLLKVDELSDALFEPDLQLFVRHLVVRLDLILFFWEVLIISCVMLVTLLPILVGSFDLFIEFLHFKFMHLLHVFEDLDEMSATLGRPY